VKAALAIVCSLVLVWTQGVLVQAPAAGAARVAQACCHCGKAGCCAAPHSPESRPAPAAPVPSSSQNQLWSLAPATLAWTLPDGEAHELSASSFSPLIAAGAPLYARNCARLI